MSADERRGTDGGDHPLDVEARFADIIAHFHDGEPAPPEVVDEDRDPGPERPEGSMGATGSTGPEGSDPAAADHAPDPDGQDPHGRDVHGDGLHGDDLHGDDLHGHDLDALDPTGTGAAERRRSGWDTADRAATDWAARYEQAAREELAAHEERTVRREREARAQAEVDRAVDRASERFVPEDPPPLPRPADLPGRLAWGAVLVGPLVLVLVALLWRSRGAVVRRQRRHGHRRRLRLPGLEAPPDPRSRRR